MTHRKSPPSDPLDELILQLETFAGFNALPLAARDIIQSAINERVAARLAYVATVAESYAEQYRRAIEAETNAALLPSPAPRKGRRKDNYSSARKADYWTGMAAMIRNQIPRPPEAAKP